MDLGYFNARVRGLRGRLLKTSDYEVFMKIEGLKEYIEHLKSTQYGPYIDVAEARSIKESELIPFALKQNIVDTFNFLWKKVPDEARPFLKALLATWEVYNLKAIIRGILKGIKREEVFSALIPAGEFDHAALDTLLDSKGIEDLIRFLDTWGSPYAGPLKQTEPVKRKSIMELELKIDMFISNFLLSAFKKGNLNNKVIRDSLALRVDEENILTLLKIAGEGFSPEGVGGFFIEGGNLFTKDLFLALSGLKDRDEVLKALIGVIKDRGLKETLLKAGFLETGVLEEFFDLEMEKRFSKLSVVEPLAIALVASFIYMKVREVRNLRILARAKHFNIPGEVLKYFLIFGR